MKTTQCRWTPDAGWSPALPVPGTPADLVLVFGSTGALKDAGLPGQIAQAFPGGAILGCTTAGEICGTQVTDDSIVVTAVTFEHTQVFGTRIALGSVKNSMEAGEALAKALPKSLPARGESGAAPLAHVLVLSDGLKVNGSELVEGMTRILPPEVALTGGLAGDGARFEETLTLWGDQAGADAVVALGLYGSRLKVGYGSLGGWDSFGPERLVTRSQGNVLYELDGKSALELYKKYLGSHAEGLPSTGLLFPLSLWARTGETPVVRTILNVDEAEQSMTFAGDVPEGSRVRLMKANFDRLIDGATEAAGSCHEVGGASAELAVLISCVGRKLVLKQRIEEEVEGVRSVLGGDTVLTGFYSYGEISPFARGGRCELHNQTMTITTFSEI